MDSLTYGILKWDGEEWQPELEIGGRNAILGFSENDIWEAGGSVTHYDGTKWNRVDGYSSNGQSYPLDQALFDNRPYRAIWVQVVLIYILLDGKELLFTRKDPKNIFNTN